MALDRRSKSEAIPRTHAYAWKICCVKQNRASEMLTRFCPTLGVTLNPLREFVLFILLSLFFPEALILRRQCR